MAEIITPKSSFDTSPTASKNHLVAIILSVLLGNFGVDRFYLGHIGLGIAKLLVNPLTLGIWWIIDVILIATKKVNNVTWEENR